jgi:hypothetical protein
MALVHVGCAHYRNLTKSLIFGHQAAVYGGGTGTIRHPEQVGGGKTDRAALGDRQ